MSFIRKSIHPGLVPHFWTLSIILYLGRSLAEPLKYLFVLSFGILLISYIWFFFKDAYYRDIFKYVRITKEFLLLGVFLVSGILLSSQMEILSIKGFVNFLGISIFLLVFFNFRTQIELANLIKGWIILTLIIGLLGLLKWSYFILELNIVDYPFLYRRGTSLVSDYNVYAFNFILSIVILFYGIYRGSLQNKVITNQIILLVFLLNILQAGSRRGIVVLALLFLIGIILIFRHRKNRENAFYKNLLHTNILLWTVMLVILLMLPFRSRIISDYTAKANIVKSIYRYSTIFTPGISYNILYDIVWPKDQEYKYDKRDWDAYATYNYRNRKSEYWTQFQDSKNADNLIYNGDFRHGLKFWGYWAKDSIQHEVIDTKYGQAVRVYRQRGFSNWPLIYKGRNILYHKDVSYTIKFKYRVIKGKGTPFQIGWSIKDDGIYINKIPYNIKELGNGWFEYVASYRFKENHHGLTVFMNSQLANTIVDFTDIELTSNDTQNKPKYRDQAIQIEGVNLFYNSNFEHGLEFWSALKGDSVQLEIIETSSGNAIRVSRNSGIEYWPFLYKGRELYYYQDLTYYLRFKFRVIQGEGTPFHIGWGLPGTDPKPIHLNREVFPLEDGWYECVASYTFPKDHWGDIRTFISSQLPNTIVDYTDIELLCQDPLNRPTYADENIDLIRNIQMESIESQLASDETVLMHERLDRWKYALELWRSDYRWHQKLFGGGFDYLQKFGRKFYPQEDRTDYPHNPVISAFLYSGIIGGLFYTYFLVLSFLYYWRYRKHHMLLFILYLLTFTFVFISSNSHFNVPVFAMLSLVPFITRYIVEEKEQKNST
jgi:hypothetical protein